MDPNEFLVSVAHRLPSGRALCLGAGEGRNAVWLARAGFSVTAVDSSRVGLDKAERLAAAGDVAIEVVHADLADFAIVPKSWDVVLAIFCHLPPSLRKRVHGDGVAGLRRGGAFVLEAFTPAQLGRGTGGPSKAEMMMDLESLRSELTGLDLLHAVEVEREVQAGAHHAGLGAVVQVFGIKE